MTWKTALLSAALVGLIGVQGAKASTVTFGAVDSGWYDNVGGNAKGLIGPTDINYFAGQYPTGSGMTYNNYFVFNISGVVGNILSATLTLDDSGAGAMTGGPLTYSVGSVSDAASSVSSSTASVTIYNDLAGGTLFGSEVGINAAGDVVITLDAAALTALASAGTGFVIGGTVSSPSPDGNDHYLFTNPNTSSDESPIEQLSITTDATTPEPGSLGMLGCGLVALGFFARRLTAPCGHRS
jgi:hypothetical protein